MHQALTYVHKLKGQAERIWRLAATLMLSSFLALAQNPSPNGQITMTSFTNLGDVILANLFYIGAVILAAGLVVGLFSLLGHNKMAAFGGAALILVGGLVMGSAKIWVGTTTGVTLN